MFNVRFEKKIFFQSACLSAKPDLEMTPKAIYTVILINMFRYQCERILVFSHTHDIEVVSCHGQVIFFKFHKELAHRSRCLRLSVVEVYSEQGPVVRKSVNANPRLKDNRGFSLAR